MLEFRILGSLSVLDNGHEIPLGGGRQRVVLAILLIHRCQVVSLDRIIDELWGERPPETAKKTVQVYVSRLRKALGDGLLLTRGGGYVLELEPDQLDADRFERLVRKGRDALDRGDAPAAAELLSQALALWRGGPLAEFAYEEVAREEIARLEELRLAALEERVEADLALGRHADLVPELEALVRQHPVREHVRGQLMLALYRSGRQADALETYRQAQRALQGELGLDPGPELRELERAILAQEPAIAAPSRRRPAPRPLDRRRGGLLIALGAVVLLATVLGVAILLATGDEEPDTEALRDDTTAVAVIDPAANRLTGLARVGTSPGPLAFDSRSRSLWVGNVEDESVTRIATKPVRVGRTIGVGDSPDGLAAGGGVVWVASATRSHPFVSVRRIDTRFDALGRALKFDSLPDGDASVAVHGRDLWVAPALGLLARLRAQSGAAVRTGIEPGQSPTAIAAGPDAAWLADDHGNVVTRIDARTGAPTQIPVGNGPADIALTGGAAWVTLGLDDAVARIDSSTGSVRETIRVGRRPAGLAAGAGAVWVANSGDGTVSRLDPRSGDVTAEIPVGGSPEDIVTGAGRVWVSVRPRRAGEQAADGGVLRVETSEQVNSLDPALLGAFVDGQVDYATCAKLLNYPDEPGRGGARLEPELAAALPTVSDGGRTYRFRIRKGYRFSPPSGEPVTAATMKYSIERSLSPRIDGPGAGILTDVRSVRAAGDTLMVRLARPSPSFLARIATPFFCAVPIGTPIDPEGVQPVPAAGPYYVDSYVGDELVLRRNPNYSGPRPRRLDEIRITLDAGSAGSIAKVEAGEIDYVLNIDSPTAIRRLAARYGADSPAAREGAQRYFSHRILSLDHLAFNTGRPPFSSARLRRAVNFALDRRALARAGGIASGLPADPTDQYLPPTMAGFQDAHIYPLCPDLSRARLLTGAARRTVVLYNIGGRPTDALAEIVKSNLRAIGIEVQIKNLGPGLFERISMRDEPFDMALVAWFADYPDPLDFLDQLDGRTIRENGNGNFAYFDDPAYNRRLDAAGRLPRPARLLALGRLDASVAREQAPWAAISNERVHDFFSERIGCQLYTAVYLIDLAALCIRP